MMIIVGKTSWANKIINQFEKRVLQHFHRGGGYFPGISIGYIHPLVLVQIISLEIGNTLLSKITENNLRIIV